MGHDHIEHRRKVGLFQEGQFRKRSAILDSAPVGSSHFLPAIGTQNSCFMACFITVLLLNQAITVDAKKLSDNADALANTSTMTTGWQLSSFDYNDSACRATTTAAGYTKSPHTVVRDIAAGTAKLAYCGLLGLNDKHATKPSEITAKELIEYVVNPDYNNLYTTKNPINTYLEGELLSYPDTKAPAFNTVTARNLLDFLVMFKKYEAEMANYCYGIMNRVIKKVLMFELRISHNNLQPTQDALMAEKRKGNPKGSYQERYSSTYTDAGMYNPITAKDMSIYVLLSRFLDDVISLTLDTMTPREVKIWSELKTFETLLNLSVSAGISDFKLETDSPFRFSLTRAITQFKEKAAQILVPLPKLQM